MKKGSVLVRIVCAMPLLLALHALAGSEGVHGGGGDICEDRIKQIRDDIKSWIYKGGAKGLLLPHGISSDHYADLMLDQVKATRVKCVGAGDRGYPVAIGSTPKVCKFSIGPTGSQITCDYAKFLATSESEQYVLIHHEYAGLAGIEVPNRDDSRYDVSNQISSYLEDQVVKKLAVKPASTEPRAGSRVVIEDLGNWPRAVRIIETTSDRSTYFRVRLILDEYGRLGAEQMFDKSEIKGIEVSGLNGVTKGQNAECVNIDGMFNARFKGRVAHIYSNGFVEVELLPQKASSQSNFTSLRNYWSSVPGARETPHFDYPCSFD